MGLRSYVTYRPSLGRGVHALYARVLETDVTQPWRTYRTEPPGDGIDHELCVLGQAAIAWSGPNGGEGVDLTPPCQTDDEVESFICFI